ncbi:MAG: hypothetical protein CM1200mP41_36990 [Gammaproteobacteria bacterium]|nr:MAG: hypothetical protein CM1200mP41_36990 [Gammaproteobacteria bacterium]
MIDRIQPASIPKSTAPFSPVVLEIYAHFPGWLPPGFPRGPGGAWDVGAETTAGLK